MAYDRDHLRYYSALGVECTASAEEIKKAFKAKAKNIHPDRNAESDATRKFQFLNEAFRTLKNPETRARYDAGSFSTAEPFARPSAPGRFAPIVCSVCGKISGQPRYAIYYRVLSVIAFSQRRVTQGIFCSECGRKAAYRASVFTWALGWWGIPWGPLWSIAALLRNMLGGEQPAANNFKVVGWQAIYFVSVERPDIARSVALDALKFWEKLSAEQKSADPGIGQLEQALRKVLAVATTSSGALPNVWGVGSTAFKLQAVGGGVLIAAIAAAVTISINLPKTAYRHVPPSDEASAPAQPAAQPTPVFNQPALPYPPTGQMRALRQIGSRVDRAPLKVVAASNGPNYYVKLVSLQSGRAAVVLFLRSGETAEVEIPTGTYDFRYASGATWYGEEFLFGPATTYSRAGEKLVFSADGDHVWGHTIELIKQVNGNLQEIQIAPTEF